MKLVKSAMRRLIAHQLEVRVKKLIRTRKLKVVAVTGSVGKTSTKLAVATVLRQKYRVLAHEGNFNSEIGLPLSIFELDVPKSLGNPFSWITILDKIDAKLKSDYPYDILVLEMGADQVGDIQKFMKYITPDIGIVTAIAPVHIEQFGSVEAIAYEKMALARDSKAALLNAEDKRVMDEASKLNRPISTYGVGSGQTHFEGVKRSKDLTLGGKLVLNEDEVAVQSNFVGTHSLRALAAAAAVGEELSLSAEQIKAGVELIKPFAGRMQVLAGKNDSVLIDDTYNASPDSVIAALETLTELPGRRIAILGSMNELGDYAEEGHRLVGKAAKSVNILVTIGANANKYIVAGAAESGLASEQIHPFDSPFAAGEFVAGIIEKGDVVLAKGSQNGVFAEEALALLLKDTKDRSKLVRQSPQWQEKKRAQFDN